MRFVSKYQKYSVCVKPEKSYHTADGTLVVQESPIVCNFEHGGLTAYEAASALAHFQFKGMPDGVTPEHRLSVFDTTWQGWDAETRELVESRLAERIGAEYMKVELPAAPKPWPAYDSVRGRGQKTTAQLIADKVREDGYAPEMVILYERENQNRIDVIRALEDLKLEQPADELEVLA